MRPPFRPLLIVIAALFPLHPAFADADGEREYLAIMLHELKGLRSLQKAAQAQANPDARIRFKHAKLKHEIELVKKGIEAHLYAPQTQPRQFPPLDGDYRH